jgi:hypothetical protein
MNRFRDEIASVDDEDGDDAAAAAASRDENGVRRPQRVKKQRVVESSAESTTTSSSTTDLRDNLEKRARDKGLRIVNGAGERLSSVREQFSAQLVSICECEGPCECLNESVDVLAGVGRSVSLAEASDAAGTRRQMAQLRLKTQYVYERLFLQYPHCFLCYGHGERQRCGDGGGGGDGGGDAGDDVDAIGSKRFSDNPDAEFTLLDTARDGSGGGSGDGSGSSDSGNGGAGGGNVVVVRVRKDTLNERTNDVVPRGAYALERTNFLTLTLKYDAAHDALDGDYSGVRIETRTVAVRSHLRQYREAFYDEPNWPGGNARCVRTECAGNADLFFAVKRNGGGGSDDGDNTPVGYWVGAPTGEAHLESPLPDIRARPVFENEPARRELTRAPRPVLAKIVVEDLVDDRGVAERAVVRIVDINNAGSAPPQDDLWNGLSVVDVIAWVDDEQPRTPVASAESSLNNRDVVVFLMAYALAHCSRYSPTTLHLPRHCWAQFASVAFVYFSYFGLQVVPTVADERLVEQVNGVKSGAEFEVGTAILKERYASLFQRRGLQNVDNVMALPEFLSFRQLLVAASTPSGMVNLRDITAESTNECIRAFYSPHYYCLVADESGGSGGSFESNGSMFCCYPSLTELNARIAAAAAALDSDVDEQGAPTSQQAVEMSQQTVVTSRQAVEMSQQAVVTSRQAVVTSQRGAASAMMSKQSMNKQGAASTISEKGAATNSTATNGAVTKSTATNGTATNGTATSRAMSQQVAATTTKSAPASAQGTLNKQVAAATNKQVAATNKQVAATNKQVAATNKQATAAKKQCVAPLDQQHSGVGDTNYDKHATFRRPERLNNQQSRTPSRKRSASAISTRDDGFDADLSDSFDSDRSGGFDDFGGGGDVDRSGDIDKDDGDGDTGGLDDDDVDDDGGFDDDDDGEGDVGFDVVFDDEGDCFDDGDAGGDGGSGFDDGVDDDGGRSGGGPAIKSTALTTAERDEIVCLRTLLDYVPAGLVRRRDPSVAHGGVAAATAAFAHAFDNLQIEVVRALEGTCESAESAICSGVGGRISSGSGVSGRSRQGSDASGRVGSGASGRNSSAKSGRNSSGSSASGRNSSGGRGGNRGRGGGQRTIPRSAPDAGARGHSLLRMQACKDQRELANAINKAGQDCFGKQAWCSYSDRTVSALEQIRCGQVLNCTAEPAMTRLLAALDNMQHVPQLRLFVSLQSQGNISERDGKRRSAFWSAFCQKPNDFIEALCRQPPAPVAEERDDDAIEKHLQVSSALCADDANAERDLRAAVRAALAEFNGEHGSGDALFTALIAALVNTNSLERAMRLSANNQRAAAIRLVSLMGDVVQALHRGYARK